MEKWNQEHAPTLISATLNRYNYIDYKLWTQIKTELVWNYADSNSIMVSKKQIKMLINLHYPGFINLLKITDFENLHQHSNSIFFILKLIENFPNLKWFIFTLNNNTKHSRIVSTPTGPILRFNYRIMQATIRLYDVWDPKTLKRINSVLLRLGLIDKNRPYKRVKAQDLIALLDGYSSGADETALSKKDFTALVDFLDQLSDKFETDNPTVLLVTDYF